MDVVASLSQSRTAAAQCGLFTYKSVPVIFEPPCINIRSHNRLPRILKKAIEVQAQETIQATSRSVRA